MVLILSPRLSNTSSYSVALVGSTIGNALLMKYGMSKNVAFWSTIFGSGILNFFLLKSLISTKSADEDAQEQLVVQPSTRSKISTSEEESAFQEKILLSSAYSLIEVASLPSSPWRVDLSTCDGIRSLNAPNARGISALISSSIVQTS